MRSRLLPLLTAAAIVSASSVSARPTLSESMVSSALSRLDATIARSDRLDAEKLRELTLLGQETDTASGYSRMPLLLSLGDDYRNFLVDSASAIYQRGIETARSLGEEEWELRFRLRQLSVWPLLGLGDEAMRQFRNLNPENLSDSLQLEAYEAGRRLYAYLAPSYSAFPAARDSVMRSFIEMLSHEVKLMDSDNPEYVLRHGELLYYTGRYREAEPMLREYYEDLPEGSPYGGVAANLLSLIADEKGDQTAYIYYLARSATDDILTSTREMLSLQQLGMALYESGEVNRAYDYLTAALSKAVECNARVRVIQSSEIYPIVATAYREELQRSSRNMLILAIFMAVGALVILVMFLRLRRTVARMNALQKVLSDANRVKEMYMSQFLNLCTTYIDKLNRFCHLAERKLSTGHTDELYRLVKSGRFVEEQSKEFYDTFDRTFLNIYPDFVERVNDLLRPGEKIELKEGELLNTDLRILAFMRLGIEESTRIAQVLNYSVHTIYAYRNRLRNRAINRDTLEADIMTIGRH